MRQSGAIFKNWKSHVERPEGIGEPLAYWLDFGYVNDPSACGRSRSTGGAMGRGMLL